MKPIINSVTNPAASLLISRPMVTCLADAVNASKPKMLFSEFWHQGELAVLFGNENSGKAALAVQLADAISTGSCISGFTTETEAQKVLYFDFDTGERQLASRYDGCNFSDNFIRVTINREHCELRKFGEQLFAGIDAALEEHGAKVIVVDSLSTLKYFVNDLYFFTRLLQLKKSKKLSILLLAATKNSTAGKPLAIKQLAANKMLGGIADSVFAMGPSKTRENGSYLIHLKGKEMGTVYHQNRVVTGRNTVTPVTGLPGFEFTGYGTEHSQLMLTPPIGELEARILECKRKAPNASLAEIAKWTGTNKMKVKRVLERCCEGNPGNLNSESETLTSNPSRGEFGSPGHISKPGAKDNQRTDFRIRGNDGLHNQLRAVSPGLSKGVTPVTPNLKPETVNAGLTNSFTGDVKPSNHPSGPGVTKPERTLEEKLAGLKAEMGLTPDGKELTYSQQLKKRLAQARMQRKK